LGGIQELFFYNKFQKLTSIFTVILGHRLSKLPEASKKKKAKNLGLCQPGSVKMVNLVEQL
jgi:hypothetical protein